MNCMPANSNIKYQSDQIRNFYSTHRVKWSQLYRSEQTILEQLDLSHRTTILDIGCGSGGLGLALKERFGVERYTGVEINASAAQAAQTLNPDARILQGDILEIPDGQLGQYDLVVSLSCIDWNVEFDTMLTKAWGLVSGGGGGRSPHTWY